MNTSVKCEFCQCSAQEKHERMPKCSQVVLWRGKKPQPNQLNTHHQIKNNNQNQETINFSIELQRFCTCMSYIFPVKGSLDDRRTEENKIRATYTFSPCSTMKNSWIDKLTNYCKKLLNLQHKFMTPFYLLKNFLALCLLSSISFPLVSSLHWSASCSRKAAGLSPGANIVYL